MLEIPGHIIRNDSTVFAQGPLSLESVLQQLRKPMKHIAIELCEEVENQFTGSKTHVKDGINSFCTGITRLSKNLQYGQNKLETFLCLCTSADKAFSAVIPMLSEPNKIAEFLFNEATKLTSSFKETIHQPLGASEAASSLEFMQRTENQILALEGCLASLEAVVLPVVAFVPEDFGQAMADTCAKLLASVAESFVISVPQEVDYSATSEVDKALAGSLRQFCRRVETWGSDAGVLAQVLRAAQAAVARSQQVAKLATNAVQALLAAESKEGQLTAIRALKPIGDKCIEFAKDALRRLTEGLKQNISKFSEMARLPTQKKEETTRKQIFRDVTKLKVRLQAFCSHLRVVMVGARDVLKVVRSTQNAQHESYINIFLAIANMVDFEICPVLQEVAALCKDSVKDDDMPNRLDKLRNKLDSRLKADWQNGFAVLEKLRDKHVSKPANDVTANCAKVLQVDDEPRGPLGGAPSVSSCLLLALPGSSWPPGSPGHPGYSWLLLGGNFLV